MPIGSEAWPRDLIRIASRVSDRRALPLCAEWQHQWYATFNSHPVCVYAHVLTRLPLLHRSLAHGISSEQAGQVATLHPKSTLPTLPRPTRRRCRVTPSPLSPPRPEPPPAPPPAPDSAATTLATTPPRHHQSAVRTHLYPPQIHPSRPHQADPPPLPVHPIAPIAPATGAAASASACPGFRRHHPRHRPTPVSQENCHFPYVHCSLCVCI